MEVAEVDTACNVKETPEFAVICSFIEIFGDDLNISLTHQQLIRCLQLNENDNIPKIWIDLHRKLLGKIKFSCSIEKWEMRLQNFLFNFFNRNLAIEFCINFTKYDDLKPLERVKVLNILFDSQFDRNAKFKEKINAKPHKTLRNVPFGGDIYGCSYWLFVDSEKNVLFYKENLEEETFKLMAENVDQLIDVEGELKKVEVESIDLSKLYKYPEDVDSPLAEYINDLGQNKQKTPEDASIAILNEHSFKNEPLVIDEVKNDISEVVLSKDTVKGEEIKLENDTKSPVMNSKLPENRVIKMETDISEIENDSVKMIDINKHVPEDEIKENTEEMKHEVRENSMVTMNESVEKEEIPQLNDKENNMITENSEKVSNDICDVTPNSKENVVNKSQQSSKPKPDILESSYELRRSSRQRKPVTLFTIEHSRAGDASQILSSDESDDQKSKKKKKTNQKKDSIKSTNVKDKSNLKKNKKKHSKEETVNIKKKKHKSNGKKNKKTKRRKPWETGDDESDNEHAQSCVEEYEEHEESEEIEMEDPWANDKPESDFDPDKLEYGSNDEIDKARGRNYYRQKKREKQKKLDEDITICQICLSSQLPEMLLLCDQCDKGHHAMCLRPPLMIVPEGEWFCPKCCHTKLLTRLADVIPDLTKAKAALQAKSRMQERLNFVNISMSNMLSNRPNKSKHNYDNEVNSEDDEDDDDLSSNSSDDDDESSDASSDDSDQRPYKFRESSRKEAHKYNFKELDKMYDEALVYDEKYQWKKKHQTQTASKNAEENEEGKNDEDEDEDEDENVVKKKNGSDSEYDYSEIVPRKKSGGKDMSNLLPESDEDDQDEGDRPKIRRGNYGASGKKKRANSFSTSEEDNNGEDAKDEDFRLSDVDYDEDELDKVNDDDYFEEEDESDDWFGAKRRSSRQRNSRRLMSRNKGRHGKRSRKGRSMGVKTNSSRNLTGLNKMQRSRMKTEVMKDKYETRPRRSAARKVNYRELIGEGDEDDNELYEEIKDDESIKKSRSTNNQDASDSGSKSPDFDDDSDDDGDKEIGIHSDKPPPVVKRSSKTTKSYSVKKKQDSDSEYEQSGGFSSEEDEEEVSVENDQDDEEEIEGEDDIGEDDDTDKQQEEDDKQEDDEVVEDEPPIKKQKIDSPVPRIQNEDGDTAVVKALEKPDSTLEVIPDNKIAQISDEMKNKSSQDDTNSVNEPMKIASPSPIQPIKIASPSPIQPIEIASQPPIQPITMASPSPIQPIKMASPLPIQPIKIASQPPIQPIKNDPLPANVLSIKNPMRADDSQDEDCEDDVDSDSEFIMTSVKR